MLQVLKLLINFPRNNVPIVSFTSRPYVVSGCREGLMSFVAILVYVFLKAFFTGCTDGLLKHYIRKSLTV
jgi:hypothetical protein